MSKTNIPKDVKALLWYKAAGRCEFNGCNKRLDKHGITMDECNLANCAHIIADSPNGPRGTAQSEELAKDPDNIMLMCPECHKYIDHEGRHKYDAEILREMKRHHEERMEYLTGLKEDLQARIVTYGANIAGDKVDFSENSLIHAMMPDYYPTNKDIIHLGMNTGNEWDDWNMFWKVENINLVSQCKDNILQGLDKWEHKRIALFAIAPMPLLVSLGTLLNSHHDVVVYQKHRDSGWKWPEIGTSIDYQITTPTDYSKPPVLVLALSFPIQERIRSIRPDASIWEITINNPNPSFLRSRKMLDDFARKMELLLDEITRAGNGQPIDVYMSVPVACAITLGRVWMRKANSPLNIYDFDKRFENKDKLAITINNSTNERN